MRPAVAARHPRPGPLSRHHQPRHHHRRRSIRRRHFFFGDLRRRLWGLHMEAAPAGARWPIEDGGGGDGGRQDESGAAEAASVGAAEQRSLDMAMPRPPRPRPGGPARVSVVYYLSRNGHLEHPHFMEVTLSSPEGLYLRDVIDRLEALRGKGMTRMYSWASKRSYRNGFVWHDLTDDDYVHPVAGREYVLKGTEWLNPPTMQLPLLDTATASSCSSGSQETATSSSPAGAALVCNRARRLACGGRVRAAPCTSSRTCAREEEKLRLAARACGGRVRAAPWTSSPTSRSTTS